MIQLLCKTRKVWRPMRSLFSAWILVTAMPIFVLSAKAVAEGMSGPTQSGRIEFFETSHEFGKMFRGQVATHSFKFKNSGTGDLHIRSIHAACGCVNTRVEPSDTIKPGNSGEIQLTFDSSYFVGDIGRDITVDTDMPTSGSLILKLRASITEEVAALPPLLSLGEIGRDTKPSFYVSLKKYKSANGKGPLSFTKVVSSSKYIVAEMMGNEDKIKITFEKALPIGPLREQLRVSNNSVYLKDLVIPIIAEIKGHVKLSNQYIEFGVIRTDEPVRRKFKLFSDDKDFKVTGIDVQLRRTEVLKSVKAEDMISFETERMGEDVFVYFDMRMPKNISKIEKGINASGTFIVRTNDSDYKEILLPFFGVLNDVRGRR